MRPLDEDSDRIERGIAHLISLVIEALSAATHALLAGEPIVGQHVVDADLVIDELTVELDQMVWGQIDAASGSGELRPLIGMLLMLTEMERSADLAEHIAQRALTNLGAEMTPLSRGIVQRMSEVALVMWQGVADAYGDRSSQEIALDDADDEMDLLHERLTREIATSNMPNAFAVQVTMLARFYERLGDHAVNLAKRIGELRRAGDHCGGEPDHVTMGTVRRQLRRWRFAAALAVIALGGVAAQSAGGAAAPKALPYPLPAPAVQPEPCPPPPVPPGPPAPPLGPPAVPDSAIPVAAPPASRHVSLAAISGKGLWLTVWPGNAVPDASIISTAVRDGIHQLWVRTGSTSDGFYGSFLATLVPMAHRAGIAVIAWDFPTMSNPAADAARAAEDFHYGVNGFSADIEEEPEGTYLSAKRVAYYLSLVRAEAGNHVVVATVPRPTSSSLTSYPYLAEAPYVDAFAPMVYWSCTEPSVAVSVAMRALEAIRPVAPVGQDYNMASEGGRVGLPSGAEIWSFLDVAHRMGAVGASLYDYESGGPLQLQILGDYPWQP